MISGEIDKKWLKEKINSGNKTRRLAPHPTLPKQLTEKNVDRSIRIVARARVEKSSRLKSVYKNLRKENEYLKGCKKEE